MKKALSFLLVLLLLFPFFTVYSYAESNSTFFVTSDCPNDYLLFSVVGNKLNIEGRIVYDNLSAVAAVTDGEPVVVSAESGKDFSLSMPLTVTSAVPVSVYLFRDEVGVSYTYNRIVIENRGGQFFFRDSSVKEQNDRFYSVDIDPEACRNSDVSDTIKALAASIVGNETKDYNKLFLLNKWVAENLYYDMNYNDELTGTDAVAADTVAATRITSCEGFANLLLALVEACDIPAIRVLSYALGTGVADQVGYTFALPLSIDTSLPNHAHVEAYVDGRWVIMDPTWECRNYAQNGVKVDGEAYAFPYFDCKTDYLSLDHVLFSRGPLSLKDGKLVNANEPSDWAKEEVSAAIEATLVPVELRKAYTAPITRGQIAGITVKLLELSSGKTIKMFLAQKGVRAQSGTFSDTDDAAILACNALGILNGTGDGCFSPAKTLTRAQIGAIINRTAMALGYDTSGHYNTFLDVVGHWCASELGWPVSVGILNGVGYGKFSPDTSLTVEQTILTMYRALLVFKK